MRKVLKNIFLSFGLMSVMVCYDAFSAAPNHFIKFDFFLRDYPEAEAKVQPVLEKYYQTMISGNCSSFYAMTYDSFNLVSQEEICRLMNSRFFDFVRKYHLGKLQVLGRANEQEEIYFFMYSIKSRQNLLFQLTEDKKNFPQFSPELKKLMIKDGLALQDDLDFRYMVSIDKKTGKVDFVSVNSTAYDHIKNPYSGLLNNFAKLNQYYIAEKKDIDVKKEWAEAAAHIQQTQKAIFSSNWDIGGFPLQQAIELDREIKQLKDLGKAHNINTDSIRYCYELAQL